MSDTETSEAFARGKELGASVALRDHHRFVKTSGNIAYVLNDALDGGVLDEYETCSSDWADLIRGTCEGAVEQVRKNVIKLTRKVLLSPPVNFNETAQTTNASYLDEQGRSARYFYAQGVGFGTLFMEWDSARQCSRAFAEFENPQLNRSEPCFMYGEMGGPGSRIQESEKVQGLVGHMISELPIVLDL